MAAQQWTGPNRAVRFFDASARDYETRHYGASVRSFMTVRLARVLELVDTLQLPRGARVLDAGCGPGYLVDALASRGFRVCGLDAAEGMLQSARARLLEANPEFPALFERGSIEHLPYRDETFDLVCSTGVMEYLETDAVALGEFARVLRPGGHAVLPITNSLSPINWFDFVIESLKRRDLLRNAFNRVWTRLGNRPVLPRHFKVRRQHPARFRVALAAAGFELEDAAYFYFLPWPHPVDQFLPTLSALVGRRMERLARSPVGAIAEGYITRVKKPGQPTASTR